MKFYKGGRIDSQGRFFRRGVFVLVGLLSLGRRLRFGSKIQISISST